MISKLTSIAVCVAALIVLIALIVGGRDKVTVQAKKKISVLKIPDKVLLEDFQRPVDRDLTEQLSRFEKTGVAQYLGRFVKPYFDDVNKAELDVRGVEIRRGQFPDRPDLVKIVEDCARVLKMDRPRVYIVKNSDANAFATNFKEPIIVIHSELLDKYSDPDEIRFIIGHEMGHIRCGHVKWQMVLRTMVASLKNVPALPEDLAVLPVLQWAREAEMSADAAGLICCQNLRVAEQALIRMAHGASESELGRVDVDAFLSQSDSKTVSKFAEVLTYWKELTSGHPFIPARIRELRQYEQSRAYQHLWE